MEPKLTWGTTQKGQKLNIFNGNEFTIKLATKTTTTHWRCSKWRSHSCKATIVTCADRMLSSKNDHSHDIVPGKPEARQIVERMKFTARNEQDPVNSAVIATQVATVDEVSVQLSMPSRSALNRTLNRQKQKNNESSMIAITCTERNFALPDEYKDFCLFDSGMDDKERILIFGDATMVAALSTYKNLWLCDGTFKICPLQFYQLYTVHIQVGGFYPPCVYALLSNKKETTYQRFIAALKMLTGDCELSRILIDFEKAALNAFTQMYSSSKTSGCYFHLCQSFNRKIGELGLKTVYENYPDFALSLKMIPALAFVPPEDVEPCFNLVIEELGKSLDQLNLEDTVAELTDDLAGYFQRTYIKGEKLGRTEKKPTFSVEIWNQNRESSDGLVRTTNAVEGWHLGVTALFHGSHLPVPTFLAKIKLDSFNQKFNFWRQLRAQWIKAAKNTAKLTRIFFV